MLRPSLLHLRSLYTTSALALAFHSIGLGLPPAMAADVSLSSFAAFEHDLARPFLWKRAAGDLSLGLSFSRLHAFDLDRPSGQNNNHSQELGAAAAVRLPFAFEVGLGVSSREEREKVEALTISRKNALAPLLWLRWHALESATLRSSVGAQVEPGVKSEGSFQQVGKTRSSVFASQEWSPLSWLHGGAYLGKSWRPFESFGDWQLGDETSFGGRLGLGPAGFHVFAEGVARQLVVKFKDNEACQQKGQLYRVGLGSQLGSFDLRAQMLLDQKEDLFGLPREGFLVALHYSLLSDEVAETLAEAKPIKPKKPKKALEGEKKQTAEEGVSKNEDPELDEFQLFEKSQAVETEYQDQVVPSEIAERELKALREAAKKEQATEKEMEKQRQQEYEQAIREEVKEDNRIINKYRDDIEEELNQYALPDSEEVNWKGLPSK